MLPACRRLDGAGHGRRLASSRIGFVWMKCQCSRLCVAAVGRDRRGAALWYFLPLILALIEMPSATAEELQVALTDFVALHNQYRWIFSLRRDLLGRGVVSGHEARAEGAIAALGLIAGGVVATCVAMALLHFPVSAALFQRHRARSRRSAGMTRAATSIGVATVSDLLLFCPELPPPRNRTVKSAIRRLTPLGVRENPFSRYARGRSKFEPETL